MRFSLILCVLFVSAQAYALNIYPVTVSSEYSSNPFRGVESISLPTDGELISNYYFTNDEIFDGGNTYKRIRNISDVNSFWPYNSSNHTFTLDIFEASEGARWRQISSRQNGSTYSLGWVNLTTGTNSISLNPEGNYDRAVIGFSTEGSFKFSKFTHTFGSQAWGYEEISVVPEPSSYAWIAGVIALFLACNRRR